MMIPHRMAKHVGRSLLVVLLVGSMLTGTGLLGTVLRRGG